MNAASKTRQWDTNVTPIFLVIFLIRAEPWHERLHLTVHATRKRRNSVEASKTKVRKQRNKPDDMFRRGLNDRNHSDPILHFLPHHNLLHHLHQITYQQHRLTVQYLDAYSLNLCVF